MRDRDKLRRVKRANEVQSETLDEYRNTIKFLELKVLRLETEIEQAKQMEKQQIIDTYHINPLESKWKNIGEQYYNETFKSE